MNRSSYSIVLLLLAACVLAQVSNPNPQEPNEYMDEPMLGLPNEKSPAGPAYAAGRHVQIHYSECGTWNQFGVGGFVFDQCSPVDLTLPGNPWQALCFRIPYPNQDELLYVGNIGTTKQNSRFELADLETPLCNYTTKEAEKFPASPSEEFVGVKHSYQVGPLVAKKIETWNFYESVVHVEIFLEYPHECCHYLAEDNGYTLHDVEVAFSFDPDPDYQNFGTHQTVNQRVFGEDQDNLPDGLKRGGWYAESIGRSSCTTMGIGKCNSKSVVGHTRWQNCPMGLWRELRNNNGMTGDRTAAFWHKFDNITCGEKVGVNFIISVACDPITARDQYQEAYGNLCAPSADLMPDFDDAPTDYFPYSCACNGPVGNYSDVPCTCRDGIFDHVPLHMHKKDNLPLFEPEFS